jgi:transposase-like protein
VSEQELHWRSVLPSLVERGLRGVELVIVELVISDAHAGLQAARNAVLRGVSWQRCQFHLQQNAQAFVPRQELKREVAAEVRQDGQQAGCVAGGDDWRRVDCVAFPESHRQRLRTTNELERLNQEIRRRTRVVVVFPNEVSCLRFVSALAMETSDDWEVGNVYLSLTA